MKKYIFIMAAGAAIFIGAYLAGGRIALEKCRADYAINAAGTISATQLKNEQTKRKINAETFNTDTVVIRNRLHEKYSIAD